MSQFYLHIIDHIQIHSYFCNLALSLPSTETRFTFLSVEYVHSWKHTI